MGSQAPWFALKEKEKKKSNPLQPARELGHYSCGVPHLIQICMARGSSRHVPTIFPRSCDCYLRKCSLLRSSLHSLFITLFLLSNRSMWKIWILFPFFPKPKSNVSCHCLFAAADIIVFRVCFTGKAIKTFFSFHFLLKEMGLDSIRCIAFDSFNYIFSFLGII